MNLKDLALSLSKIDKRPHPHLWELYPELAFLFDEFMQYYNDEVDSVSIEDYSALENADNEKAYKILRISEAENFEEVQEILNES